MLPIPFGNPSTYSGHSGVDFGQPFGDVIRASGPGRVDYTGWLNDNAGYSTMVTYDGGPRVLYCHQPGLASLPSYGIRTVEGTVIGKIGSSGHSTGPHLHLEIMSGSGAHTYEGVWNYFDHRVIGESPAGGGAVPFPEENEMQLSDRILVRGGTASVTVEEVLQAVFSVYDATFIGGTSMPDNGRSIGASLDGIVDVVDRIDARLASQE